MTDNRERSHDTQHVVDALCDEFERMFRQGERPRIEELLHEIDEERRSELLSALLEVELELRRDDGEPPELREFTDRFPHDSDIVAQVWHRAVFSADTRQPESTPGPTPSTRQDPDSEALTRGRFRILEPHARGGLGEVFLARDAELNRDVALKEIQARYASDPDSRRRFVLEAEVTGNLEHPGIVPVYGLGHDEHGRPYYAMRFIEGDSLKDAIIAYHNQTHISASERTLQLRRLLGRFVDVCEAIAYAHSRGVVHRDLKPGNIMLGKYGETLVVDWGLARVNATADDTPEQRTLRLSTRDDMAATIAGSALGTPAYMPPEQATGALDKIGPASDVYSLGATLFHILTGRPAFQDGDIHALLEDVKAGRFPRPRAVAPQTPPALAAVCSKAMALSPKDRYNGPRELADEIERFLADEPVEALPESVVVRSRRWLRKHPTVSVTATAVLVVSMVGLTAHSSVISKKNAALLEANTAAERNAESAREQTQLALDTLNSVVLDVSDGLRGHLGTSQLRATIMQQALQRLDSVSREFANQAELDRNTVITLLKTGDVILEIGSIPQQAANAKIDTKGALQRAEELFRQADELAAKLASENPADANIQRDRTATLGRIGKAARLQGRTNEARTYYEQAFEMSRELLAQFSDPAIIDDVLADLAQLSEAEEILGDAELALQHATNMLELVQKHRGSDTLGRSRLAFALEITGLRLQEVSRLQDAIDHFEKAVANQSAVVQDSPSVSSERRLARMQAHLGKALFRKGDLVAAAESYSASSSIAAKLAADRADARAQRDFAAREIDLGELRLKQFDFPKALEHFETSRNVLEELAQTDPLNSVDKNSLGSVYEWLAQIHLDQLLQQFPGGAFPADDQHARGRAEAALHFTRKNAQIQAELSQADPRNLDRKSGVAISLMKTGDISLLMNDLVAAASYFSRSREINEELSKQGPEFDRLLAINITKQAQTVQRQGQSGEAVKYFQQALPVFKSLQEADPADARKRRDVMLISTYIADLHKSQGEIREAARVYEDVVQIAASLAQSDDDVRARIEWTSSLVNMATLQRQLKQFDKALDMCRQAQVVFDALQPRDRSSAQAKLTLGMIQTESLRSRAGKLIREKEFDKAAKAAELLHSSSPEAANVLVEASGLFCQIADAVSRSDSPTSVTQERMLDQALACLREAIDAGFKDVDRLRQDKSFAVLSNRDTFKKLLSELAAEPE